MIYIYKHRNKLNDKVYIGQTYNIKKRWKPSEYKTSPLFYRAIQKYGWDNFTHEVLSEIEDQNEADNQEIALIEYFDSTNPEKGYNISHGGNTPFRGRTHSEETKKKLSEINKGKKLSDNHKMKISESLKYHKQTEETKNKLSEINKGKKLSDNHKMKISENNGRKRKVKCVETGLIFDSCVKAENYYNIKGVRMAANPENKYHKIAGGYHWEYI